MIKKSIVLVFCTCAFSLYMFGRMIRNMDFFNDCHINFANEYNSLKNEYLNVTDTKDPSFSYLTFREKLKIKFKMAAKKSESKNEEEWDIVQAGRRRHLNKECSDLIRNNYKIATLKDMMLSPHRYKLANILVDDDHQTLYCYIPKVACTPWKKMMMVLTGNVTPNEVDYLTPVKIHYTTAVKTLMSPEFKEEDIQQRIKTYKKFLIVRHPAERLLSAYKDKFVSNKFDSKDFKKIYAVPMMRFARNTSKNIPLSGNGLKFKEFLHYILSQNSEILQEHWRPFFHLCHPCSLNYDYIGKYETLEIDSNQILKRIGAPPELKFPPFRRTQTLRQLKTMLLTIPKDILSKLYDIFKPDFSLFNYMPDLKT